MKPMNQRRISLAIACLLIGCSPDWVERSVQVKFDPQSTEFWDMPLPTDLRRQDSGSYGVSNWPNNSSNGYLEMWLDTIDRRLLDGWGVSSGVFTPLSGPIAPETLPQSPEASMLPDASVFINIKKIPKPRRATGTLVHGSRCRSLRITSPAFRSWFARNQFRVRSALPIKSLHRWNPGGSQSGFSSSLHWKG